MTGPSIVAQAAVMSHDPCFVEIVHRTLAADYCVVATIRVDPSGTHALEDAGYPDVVIVDRRGTRHVHRVLRRLRQRWRTCAIVVANAEDEAECMRFLDEGADDACISGAPILRSRLHAVVRRARTLNADARVVFGDIVLDREYRRAWSGARELELSQREYDILVCLFVNAPLAVARETLTEFVWRREEAPTPNAVEVHVARLRRKLACGSRTAIDTIRGVGYALTALATIAS